jgi:hypothetical protein
MNVACSSNLATYDLIYGYNVAYSIFYFMTKYTHFSLPCSSVIWTYFTLSVTIFILSSSSIPLKINFILFLGDRMQGGDEDYYLLLPGNAPSSRGLQFTHILDSKCIMGANSDTKLPLFWASIYDTKRSFDFRAQTTLIARAGAGCCFNTNNKGLWARWAPVGNAPVRLAGLLCRQTTKTGGI